MGYPIEPLCDPHTPRRPVVDTRSAAIVGHGIVFGAGGRVARGRRKQQERDHLHMV